MKTAMERYVYQSWSRNSLWGMRRRKRIKMIALAVSVVLLALVVWATTAEAEYGWIMCRPGSEVNLRSDATTHSRTVGRIFFGDRVDIDRTYRGWVHSSSIVLEEEDCWISADYVVYDEPIGFPEGRKFTIRANGRVAAWKGLRCKERNCWLKPGDTVVVYAISEDFALTNKGYVRREYLVPA